MEGLRSIPELGKQANMPPGVTEREVLSAFRNKCRSADANGSPLRDEIG
jgi:hypothetical protein